MMMMMYLFTTVPHPHGHWQLQELLGNQYIVFNVANLLNAADVYTMCKQWLCCQLYIDYFWDTGVTV